MCPTPKASSSTILGQRTMTSAEEPCEKAKGRKRLTSLRCWEADMEQCDVSMQPWLPAVQGGRTHHSGPTHGSQRRRWRFNAGTSAAFRALCVARRRPVRERRLLARSRCSVSGQQEMSRVSTQSLSFSSAYAVRLLGTICRTGKLASSYRRRGRSSWCD